MWTCIDSTNSHVSLIRWAVWIALWCRRWTLTWLSSQGLRTLAGFRWIAGKQFQWFLQGSNNWVRLGRVLAQATAGVLVPPDLEGVDPCFSLEPLWHRADRIELQLIQGASSVRRLRNKLASSGNLYSLVLMGRQVEEHAKVCAAGEDTGVIWTYRKGTSVSIQLELGCEPILFWWFFSDTNSGITMWGRCGRSWWLWILRT